LSCSFWFASHVPCATSCADGAGADAGAAAADQRRRELELGRRAILLLGQALRIGHHRLANGVDEIDGAQLAFLAEPGDDDRERARHRQHVVRVLAMLPKIWCVPTPSG
jgi:hypothetical protein